MECSSHSAALADMQTNSPATTTGKPFRTHPELVAHWERNVHIPWLYQRSPSYPETKSR